MNITQYAMYKKIFGGGSGGGTIVNITGTPIEVSSETGMNNILSSATSADNGKVYKYTGATTSEYTQGAYYLLEV